MNDAKEIEKLSEVSNVYDIFFIDLWGVVHNGIALFEHTTKVLVNLKKKKKKFFF
tara:strand:- start:156 stop:320 length:165 start_codon:yes stop_codon:yes gene_type:complete